MNYYNPYFYTIPSMGSMTATATRTGLFSRLFGGLSLSRILNGTERALNFANQAIPLVKQVKPMIGNAKTMLKVMNEFKKQEKPITNNQPSKNNSEVKGSYDVNTENINQPTFFM